MSTTPHKILLAEDDQFLRRAAEATLRQKGFTVVVAVDGEEAIAKARAEKPDLILLDLIMPKLMGFQVLIQLKADPETKLIPVVMLSNLGQDSDVRETLEAGAVAYLIKSGVRLDELAAKVSSILEGARR